MKRSEIEIALEANPQTVFSINKLRNRHIRMSKYVRILEVHEKIVPKSRYGAPEKRTVTFTCETLKTVNSKFIEREVKNENGEIEIEYDWVHIEPTVIIEKLLGVMPQDINYIVSGRGTLEDICKETQEYEIKKLHNATKAKEHKKVLFAEIKSKTKLDEWDLDNTPLKVLEVLREALNK